MSSATALSGTSVQATARRPAADDVRPAGRSRATIAALAVALALAGCDNEGNMFNQPRFETFEPTHFFEDGTSARPWAVGVIPRDGKPIAYEEPSQRPELTEDLLRRGQERFNIYCAVCHGRDGYGQGMIVLRGYPIPPTFHSERLRSVPDDHFYRVIDKGFGKMPPYGAFVAPRDRWAITAYIRALQLSQNAGINEVPEAERESLNRPEKGEGEGHGS